MFRRGDGPIRIASTGELPPGVKADADYFVADVGGSVLALERARRRRGMRFIAKWAAIRAVVAAALGALTGEYQLAATAFAVFTWFHIERVTGDWRR